MLLRLEMENGGELCVKILFHSRKNYYLTHVDKKLTSRSTSWRYVSNIFLPLFIVGEFELDTHSVRKTRRRVPLDRKDRVSWLRRVSNYTRADKCQSFNVRMGYLIRATNSACRLVH